MVETQLPCNGFVVYRKLGRCVPNLAARQFGRPKWETNQWTKRGDGERIGHADALKVPYWKTFCLFSGTMDWLFLTGRCGRFYSMNI
jgi:hypothetical protein